MVNGRRDWNPGALDRWLKANAVLGSILAIGILAMAVAGLNSVGRQDLTTEVVSSAIASR
jgi:hypothetical protein